MPLDIITQAAIVTLKAPAAGGKTTPKIHEITGIPKRTINNIYAQAIKHGFNPEQRPFQLLSAQLEDTARSGRPLKRTPEVGALIISKVSTDRFGREKTAANIAGKLRAEGISISRSTVLRFLKISGYKKTKPTRKPGLTAAIRKERLAWCITHKDWTLEDQKNIIQSDKTSVMLLHRRGSYRVQRLPKERFLRSCIREKWKGSSEFMFQAAFSYDKKGPYHCQSPETLKEKKEADKALKILNAELEPKKKEEWEIETGVRRLGLRNLPGKKPVWQWKKETGKLLREGKKGGIDWWRYQQKILCPKLLPFALECMKERPDTVVQEDKAPAHKHQAQQAIYNAAGVQRLLWCSNSPDLNAIEAAQPWMKRYTTKKGAPKNRSEAIRRWEGGQKELPQAKIRAWIERIPVHVKKIIELEGRNKYKEGRGIQV